MKILLKPIKNKENEWQPQNRIYYVDEILDNIIETENLTQDMLCVQAVNFDYVKLQYNNVVLDCQIYHDNFIFYVQDNGVNYWTYITNKSLVGNKIILTLQIDVVSSNFKIFNQGNFRGQAYIERATNFQRQVNNIHSDSCSSIENKKIDIISTNQKINKDIRVFIAGNSIQENKRLTFGETDYTGTFEYMGSTFVNPRDDKYQLNNYTSIINHYKDITDITGDTVVLVQTILTKYNIDFYSKDWIFTSSEDFRNCLDELQATANTNSIFNKIYNIITDANVNKWLTIPTFFENITDNVIANFEMDLTYIKSYLMLQEHLMLHYSIAIAIGKVFKIELDLLKIKDIAMPKLYGTRIINYDSVKFLFYYEPERLESFYDLNIDISNAVKDDSYLDNVDKLTTSYSSGLKGLFGSLGLNALQLLLTSGLGLLFGKRWALFSLFSGGIGLGFDAYSQIVSQSYADQTIKNKDNKSENVLLYDALNNTNLTVLDEIQFGRMRLAQGTQHPVDTMFVSSINSIRDISSYNFFQLIIERPLDDDVTKIMLDQLEYGNIVDSLTIKTNIFDNAKGYHLFWKGKIAPIINPVSNFMLEVLNNTLAQGVKILYSANINDFVNQAILTNLYQYFRSPWAASKNELYSLITSEFIKKDLPYEVQIYFDLSTFNFINITDINGIEITDDDLIVGQDKIWLLNYNYAEFSNQQTQIEVKIAVEPEFIIDEINIIIYYISLNGVKTKNQLYALIDGDFIKEQLNDFVKTFFNNDDFQLQNITINDLEITDEQLTNLAVQRTKLNYIYDGIESSVNLNIETIPNNDDIIAAIVTTFYKVYALYYENGTQTLQEYTDNFNSSNIKKLINQDYLIYFDENKYIAPNSFIKQDETLLTDDDLKICIAQDIIVSTNFSYDKIVNVSNLFIYVYLTNQTITNYLNTKTVSGNIFVTQTPRSLIEKYFTEADLINWINESNNDKMIYSFSYGELSFDQFQYAIGPPDIWTGVDLDGQIPNTPSTKKYAWYYRYRGYSNPSRWIFATR